MHIARHSCCTRTFLVEKKQETRDVEKTIRYDRSDESQPRRGQEIHRERNFIEISKVASHMKKLDDMRCSLTFDRCHSMNCEG